MTVQKIADAMEAAEKRANVTIKEFRQLRPDFKAISDATPGLGLIAGAYHAELVALSTKFGADLLRLHYDMTSTAQEFGIDIPSATEADGDFGIMSGGR